MMGGVDVDGIVVDVDDQSPVVLHTFSNERWRATFDWQVGGNVRPLVLYILDTTK